MKSFEMVVRDKKGNHVMQCQAISSQMTRLSLEQLHQTGPWCKSLCAQGGKVTLPHTGTSKPFIKCANAASHTERIAVQAMLTY